MQFLCCPSLHSSSTSTPRNPLHLGGAHSVDLPWSSQFLRFFSVKKRGEVPSTAVVELQFQNPYFQRCLISPQMEKLMLPELIQWNGLYTPPGSKAPSARPSARCPANFVLGPQM